MDMGISIAATNAASAANNVTQNLNTTISQLQSSVQGVEGVVKNITSTNNVESLDLTKLSSSISELEGRIFYLQIHHFIYHPASTMDLQHRRQCTARCL